MNPEYKRSDQTGSHRYNQKGKKKDIGGKEKRVPRGVSHHNHFAARFEEENTELPKGQNIAYSKRCGTGMVRPKCNHKNKLDSQREKLCGPPQRGQTADLGR